MDEAAPRRAIMRMMALARRWIALVGGLTVAVLLGACGQATTPMRPGVPLEIHRGYCLTDLEFSQRGVPVNRANTLARLSHYSTSQSHLSTGNALAIGSLGATLAGTTALTVGLFGANGSIDMSDGAATALIATGAAVGVLSWVLCITSEGQYAAAAEVYNQRFETKDGQQPAGATSSAPLEREPGDDGNYQRPESSPAPEKRAPDSQDSSDGPP